MLHYSPKDYGNYYVESGRTWLTPEHRADLARQFGCEPAEVESSLAARAAMDARIAERRQYDDPCGYERSRY